MAKLDKVAAEASAFSESATALAAKARSTLAKIETIQRTWMVIDEGEGPLTPDSYSAPAGSAERTLLDALALRRASADVLSEYGKLLACLGKGDTEEAVKSQQVLFEAAGERLEAMDGEPDGSDAADADLLARERSAEPPPHSSDVVKLRGMAAQTLGALGFVAKVARTSTPGKISGIVVLVSHRIGVRLRMAKGSEIIARLAPQAQPDVEKLSAVLVDSQEPLASATSKLIVAILRWHSAHRPAKEDPSRFSYEMSLASLLEDARVVKTALSELSDSYGKLAPAHEELTRLVAAGSDGKASEELAKSVVKGKHTV